MVESGDFLFFFLWVQFMLVFKDYFFVGVNGVNNVIFVEGDFIGRVMFYGFGVGVGLIVFVVVVDIFNIVGICQVSEGLGNVDFLLVVSSW